MYREEKGDKGGIIIESDSNNELTSIRNQTRYHSHSELFDYQEELLLILYIYIPCLNKHSNNLFNSTYQETKCEI